MTSSRNSDIGLFTGVFKVTNFMAAFLTTFCRVCLTSATLHNSVSDRFFIMLVIIYMDEEQVATLVLISVNFRKLQSVTHLELGFIQ